MFPPVLDVLLKQGSILTAYLRSAHMGSVMLLAAAVLLPFAQAGQFLAGATRLARASGGVVTVRPGPVLLPPPENDHSVKATAHSPSLGSTLVGLPVRLASSGARPERIVEALAPEEALSGLVRRDLERGPPFFL